MGQRRPTCERVGEGEGAVEELEVRRPRDLDSAEGDQVAVAHCTSSSRLAGPAACSSSTSPTSATLDASRSPRSGPGTSTPPRTARRPPPRTARRPAAPGRPPPPPMPRRCAPSPRLCSCRYAAATSRRIHPPSRRGSAQAATTSSNAVSTRTSKRRHDARSDRLTRSPSSGITPRGSGDHQPTGPRRRRNGIGNSTGAVRRQQRRRLQVGADAEEVLARRRAGEVEGPARRPGIDRSPGSHPAPPFVRGAGTAGVARRRRRHPGRTPPRAVPGTAPVRARTPASRRSR